jgi:hypothetical protein
MSISFSPVSPFGKEPALSVVERGDEENFGGGLRRILKPLPLCQRRRGYEGVRSG